MTTPDINALLNADRRNSSRGAPMGALNKVAEGWDKDTPLHVQRLRFVDGDYGADGTYWGASEHAGHVYCAFDPTAKQVRVYVRAFTRGQALDRLAEMGLGLNFHRPTHRV